MSSDLDALFASGVAHLEKQEFGEAIQCFSKVVDSAEAGPSLKAAARNRRAAIAIVGGAAILAANEWAEVLETDGALPEDRAAARDGLSHLAGVADQPGGTVTPQQLQEHGVLLLKMEQLPVAIAAFTLAAHDSGASLEQRGNALNHRGFSHLKAGDEAAASADWNRVLKIDGASEMTLLLARRGLERIAAGRGLQSAENHWKGGDIPAAIAKYQSVMESTGGNGFDQFVAAGALLKLPGVPESVRQQAEQLQAKMLGSSKQEITPSMRESAIREVNALQRSLTWYVLANVLAFGIVLLIHSALGAIVVAVMFLPLAIIGYLVTQDWSVLTFVPTIGAIIGVPVGAGNALKSWFGSSNG